MDRHSWHGCDRREYRLFKRVHDLKHSFGRRLRAAGVSIEDRQDLLEHRFGRTTTHYSAAELSRLLEAANSVCRAASDSGNPEIVALSLITHQYKVLCRVAHGHKICHRYLPGLVNYKHIKRVL